jgi:hypothetical protein
MKFKIVILLFLVSIFATAQSGMQMENGKKKITIPFKLINNLIFIPINVNGVELNFLLDTGSSETILFGLDDADTINFQNVEKIKLLGYGSADFIDGLKSTNNQLSINGFSDNNHTIYIVLNQDFNLSSQVGIPVNGIIGNHFFENCLVETNYQKRKIFIYKENPKIRKKIAEKYLENQITIENNKPYFTPEININNKTYNSKLLIDSGSSDALWLFKNDKNGFEIPSKNIDDFLGKGFSGAIYGKRARIDKISINKFEFLQPLVSFPDINETKKDAEIYDRDGSIGGEILKRFTVFYDYPNDKIYFKKNSSFNLPFNYNMSGIELQHDGLQWIKEIDDSNKTAVQTIKFDLSSEKVVNFQYKFSLKPIFKIYNIRKNSPAEKCGLQKEDEIISINNTMIYNYSLLQINELLKSDEGKNINILISRNGKEIKFSFKLEVII